MEPKGDIQSQPTSEPAGSDSEQQLQVKSEVEIRDVENDALEFTQLTKRWNEAELTAVVHSKINASRTPQSRWYYKQ